MENTPGGTVGLLAGAVASLLIFGSGTASAANEFSGETYGQAAGAIKAAGQTIIITSRIGEFLPTDKCIITGSHYKDGYSKVLVSLNCNDVVSGAHAGNSVATKEGKDAKALRDNATQISEAFAEQTAAGKPLQCEEFFKECSSVCTLSGACSAELMKFLGL